MQTLLLGIGAGLISFMIGGLWYGLIFRQAWLDAVQMNVEEIKAKGGGKTEMPFALGAELIVATLMVYFLKTTGLAPIQTAFIIGLISSLAAAKNYIYEKKMSASSLFQKAIN